MQIIRSFGLLTTIVLTAVVGCGPSNQAAPDSGVIDAAASESAAQAVENDERAHHAENLGKKKK